MIKQINNQNIVSNLSNPQMYTTFKANPVATTNTLERTPTTDTLVKPTQNKTKKTLLILGGIALAGVGLFFAAKKGQAIRVEKAFADLKKQPQKAQKTFQEVFLREDITEKEALEMVNRYKEIEKIRLAGNKKEYIEAVFNEAKQNYGFKDKPIQLLIQKPENLRLNGECDSLNRYIMINPDRNMDKIFKTVHHEFRHAKQHELIYNLNPERVQANFIARMKIKHPEEINKILDDIIEKNKENIDKNLFNANSIDIRKIILEHFPDEYQNVIIKNFGQQSLENIPKSQKKLADDLLKSVVETDWEKYYKDGEYYLERFFEQDARFAGESIAKLFGLMAK